MQPAARVSILTAFSTIEHEGEAGRLIEHGPTDQIFRDPAHPRTGASASGRFG
jgi:ABC-type phosphate transport system ATPase subunit